MKREQELEEAHNLEILKAVAQAWHGHSGNSRPANEFDAYRRSYKHKPTRFMLEAMNKKKKPTVDISSGAKWDFGQSLWDSYEIVAVSKRLEEGLVLDHPFLGTTDGSIRARKKRKESKNSLRNLFNRMSSSSRRFNEAGIPHEDVPQF